MLTIVLDLALLNAEVSSEVTEFRRFQLAQLQSGVLQSSSDGFMNWGKADQNNNNSTRSAGSPSSEPAKWCLPFIFFDLQRTQG